VSKDYHYYKLGDLEIINSSKLNLVADHEEKTLLLLPPDKKYHRGPKEPDLDTMLKKYSSISYTKVNDDQGMYELGFAEGAYKSLKVYFNTKTFMIEKLVSYFAGPMQEKGFDKAPPRMEITYKKLTGAAANREAFSLSKFVLQVKGKYKPAQSFRGYEFINNLK
jgi:hypothetical protein